MDPFSIYELTTTVLEVSWKIYKFFDAVHGAPEEVKEYLKVLQSSQIALGEVRDYLEKFKESKIYQHDPTMLKALETVLKECYATFTLQWQTIEKYKTDDSMSMFKKLRKQVAFVMGEDAIKQTTVKLEGSQQLLLVCLSTSTGRTTIDISDNVASVQADVKGIAAVLQANEEQRIQFQQTLDQFTDTLMREMGLRSKFAQDSSLQSSTRLDDLIQVSDNIVTPDAVDIQPPKPSTNATSEQVSEHDPSAEPEKDFSSSAAAVEAYDHFRHSLPSGTIPFYEVDKGSGGHDAEALRIRQQAAGSGSRKKYAQLNEALGKNTAFLSTLNVYFATSSISSLFGKLQLLSSSSDQALRTVQRLTETLTEMSETIKISNRELDLHPNSTMYELVVEGYQALFGALQACYDMTQVNRTRFIFLSAENDSKLDEQLYKIRKITDKLLREADYRHRVEMHKASNKITIMHLEQQKMIRMLDDQKRLLESMQQERKIMDVVRDQQKILQMLFQIQMSLPSAPACTAIDEAPPRKSG